MPARSPRRRRALIAFASLCLIGACAPTAPEPTGAAGEAAALFLAACAAGDGAAWRAHLVRGERDDPQWSPGPFAGGRVIDVKRSDGLAIAHVSSASPNAAARPLVLRLEDQSWRISLAESLAAWAAEPPRRMELLARP